MRFEGTAVLDHDEQRVWELISDPEVLASSIPDVIEVERVSETTYQSTIQKSVLRFSVTLATEVELTELEPPDRIVAHAEGVDMDAQSSYLPSRGMEAEAVLEMSPTDDGQTAVDYDIEMEFHGPHVEMAAKAIKGEIESDIDTFFENVDDYE